MKQEPKAQRPGIELSFSDGITGRIWGVSGIEDMHGASFEKAGSYLIQRAALDDAFNWKIYIELEQVISSAFNSLLRMILTLDDVAAEKPERRTITMEWYINPGDDSMRSIAEGVKAQLDQRPRKGARLEIIKLNRDKTRRRP